MRVYLTGFMGSGKSFVGRRMAERTGKLFVDLDELIEKRARKPISDIFVEEGEAAFRIYEKECLHTTALLPDAVIACGGGTPCYFDNMTWINEHGMSIFLNVSAPLLAQRLQGEKSHRPLIQNLDDAELLHFIRKKLEARLIYYREAEVVYTLEEEHPDVAGDLLRSFSNIIGH